ncbi:MAG: ABC-2 family transporter protein [Nanoarchaeota archaeon]|nr:ABC-2 family transporter protein [Nanoarchaeota archaeon]
MFSRYYGIFISRIKESFIYRFSSFVQVIASGISLFIIWYIWKAIYASAGTTSIGGFAFPEMMTYMTLSVIFNMVLATFQEHEIEREVRSGKIATYLIKPVSYPLVCFTRTIAGKTSQIFTRLIPLLIVAFFIIKISIPVSWIFLLSLGLGYLINYNLVFLTGLMTFWTKGNIWGVRLSRTVIVSIFSGSLLPLIMFPEWFVEIANMLPFIAMFHIPASIYLGSIASTDIISSLLLQGFWLILLTSFTFIVWKRAEKKMFIQGG